jgi:hypothetical protein
MNGTKIKHSCDCCNEFILQIQISYERETLQVSIGNTDKLDISEMLTRSADFKMVASVREKRYCVLKHAKTSSVTVVQRNFRTRFAKKAPHRHNITRWVKQFEATSCLCKGKITGRPFFNNEVVENIRAT